MADKKGPQAARQPTGTNGATAPANGCSASIPRGDAIRLMSPDYRGPALWRGPDADQPVIVTGCLGVGPDDEIYMSVASSTAGIPLSQLAEDNSAPVLAATLAAMHVHPNGSGPAAKPPSLFPLLTADDLAKLPPLRWLVDKEIPAEGFMVLYGATGSGKSFVALDYALRIAQDQPVVYVAAEGAHGYASRVLAWQRHHKLPAGQLSFIVTAPNLLDPAHVTEIEATVAEVKPALIIVDTLARTMVGGDENTQRDMGQFVAACDRIRTAAGGTVMIVHHTGRNGNHERGSTVLRGAADQVISIENDDSLIRLACEKSKDTAGFPQRGLRLVTVETGRTAEDGTPETSCVLLPSDQVTMSGTLTRSGRTLLETLALDVFQITGARASVLIDTTGMKPTTFYRVASQLVRDGLVRQDVKGDPYYITTDGTKRLTVN